MTSAQHKGGNSLSACLWPANQAWSMGPALPPMATMVRELREIIPVMKQHPLVTFHCANSVYGLVYGYASCDWSVQPLIVERAACGAAMALAHANPYTSWWTTYWHLATLECRLRGRDMDIRDYQPFLCILETPSMSEMTRREKERERVER